MGPLSKNDLLSLFNLEDDAVEDISFINKNGIAMIDVLLHPNYPPCPRCGNTRVWVKDFNSRQITHSILTDRQCILIYRARRYICPVCGRTYLENNPFSFRSSQISALTVQNLLRDLKSANETFSSVALRYHVSPTSACSVFDQYVSMSRLPLPELMCWDECYAFYHRGEDSKYVFTILDFDSQIPIDLLPSRRKGYLTSYFMSLPKEERDNVKMIATDMYREYRYIIHQVFPKAIHSCDHYHVSQELTRKVDKVRIRVMKSVTKYIRGTKRTSDEYYLLKKFNWLIFKRYDSVDHDGRQLFDPNRERKMNQKLGRLLNYYDIRDLIEAIHPDLKAAWRLKDDLTDFYEKNTYDTAEEALTELILSFSHSGITEMKEFGRTLANWKEEIINSFIVVKKKYKVDKDTGQVVVSDIKLNNGLMENRNSILKIIKKNANGYTCWNRFRNRALYVLRPDAVPLLNPVIPPKREKNKKEIKRKRKTRKEKANAV